MGKNAQRQRTINISDKLFIGPNGLIIFKNADGTEVTIGREELTSLDARTGITAYASGGQTNAVALSKGYNNVTTVATDGDSVKLPAPVIGGSVTVKNSGATSLAVFPGSADSINAMAVNLSVNIAPGGELTFAAINTTVWETNEVLVLPAPSTQKGEFIVKATNNDGDTVTTLTNSGMAQTSVISIPDPGAATANIVLTDQANDGVRVTATATELSIMSGVTATAAEINTSSDQSVQKQTPGAGITDGSTTVFHSSIEHVGTLFKTTIFVDMADLESTTTDLNIIGTGASPSHMGQITAALNGTIFKGQVTWIETPATGADDIIFYSADESTGKKGDDVAGLTDKRVLYDKTAAASGDVATPFPLTALPGPNQYLYLANGEAGTPGTYSTGQFVLELWGA